MPKSTTDAAPMTHTTETMTAGCVAWSVVVVVVVVVVVAVVVIVVVVVGGAATGSADVRTQRLPNTNVGQSLVDVNNDWCWCWCSLFRDGRGVLRDDGTTSSVLLLPKAKARRKAL